MNQPIPRPGEPSRPEEERDIERTLPDQGEDSDIERPAAFEEARSSDVEREDGGEEDLEDAYDYDPEPERRTVTMGRGAFLTMVTLGVLAILALGVATIWLALDRGADDPVVATVNGESIPRSEYDRAVAQNNGSEVLDNLVLEYLISGEARKRNISVDAAETTKLLDEQKQQFGSDAAFQAALQQAGLTEQDLTKQLRLSAMLRRMVAEKVQVTDDEVNQTFSANSAQYAGQSEGQAKEQIRTNLQRQKENTAARDFIEQLRAEAKIETKLPGRQS
jgi:foldase protein PrsA